MFSRSPLLNRSLRMVVLLAALGALRAEAAVMGGAKAKPYGESVESTRKAAEAVLARRGAETCLRGKLTNALLGLSASCGAAGERNGLCALADEAVVQMGWSMDFMDTTARELLKLMGPSSEAGGREAAAR